MVLYRPPPRHGSNIPGHIGQILRRPVRATADCDELLNGTGDRVDLVFGQRTTLSRGRLGHGVACAILTAEQPAGG